MMIKDFSMNEAGWVIAFFLFFALLREKIR